MSKYKVYLLGVILSLSLIVSAGCSTLEKPIAAETMEFSAVPVNTELPNADKVYKSIYTLGEVKSSEQFNVNAMVRGEVVNVFYKVGDTVKKNDVLFTIESKDFEVDKDSKLKQAANSVSQAKLSYDNAKESYDKYKVLAQNGAISKTELDGAKTQLDNATIAHENAIKNYDSLKYTYKSQGENYKIVSPVTGMITAKNVTKGMQATEQNGYTIEVVDQYIVSSQVASKYINDIKIGQDVDVFISTLDKKIKGKINTISMSGKNGSYPVEIMLDSNATKEIKAGMYADVWIITSNSPEGLWIPSKSLIEENGESFVYTVDKDKAHKVNVSVLYKTGNQIAVKGDLSANSQIITYGKEYVIDEGPVQIK